MQTACGYYANVPYWYVKSGETIREEVTLYMDYDVPFYLIPEAFDYDPLNVKIYGIRKFYSAGKHVINLRIRITTPEYINLSRNNTKRIGIKVVK